MQEDLSIYKFLFDSAKHGIIIQNERSEIIKANPAAEEILGHKLKELMKLHMNSACWQGVDEDGEPIQGIDHPCMKALTTGAPVEGEIMGFVHPVSGKYRWLNINAIPEFSPGATKRRDMAC